MAVDYETIRRENERRYGTDIGRIGPMLLANRYAERTHFIYELLQNAEDALKRRGPEWKGKRVVTFSLDGGFLRVSHYGIPFDEKDVRGICGIAEGTKELTDIGRFGIGFKSVYAFTGRPEVHSGEEDFAVENFVWPVSVAPIERDGEETVFILPFRPEDAGAATEIAAGLRRLGSRVLLFLKAVDEVAWCVQGGPSGHYLRGRPTPLSGGARKVELIWQESGDRGTRDETWLVFARPVQTEEGKATGCVEVALRLERQEGKETMTIARISGSPLVAFFPTAIETHLGFLVQGPYRTTPSRDNVPKDDPWNRHLVQETSQLLVDALQALQEMNLLDAEALRALPLDRTKFSDDAMFSPLFEAVREALRTRDLLPRYGGGYVAALQAKLARSQELRELVGLSQLASLFGQAGLAWLSEDITQDRTPELRQYLMRELQVQEVRPEDLLLRLDKPFLEAQSDEWIVRLYEFLAGLPGQRGRLDEIPLIRLADGTHVKPKDASGRPQAFLPGAVKTGFPTVKNSVCGTETARKFLQSLGVREPDPVDDVILNVLPKYHAAEEQVGDEEYADDVRRFLAAYQTDSTSQRSKLTDALGKARWVRAVDAGNGSRLMAKPVDVYLATERLKCLFEEVQGVLLVDASCDCLRGEDVRDLLVASGAARYLRPVPVQPNFTWKELSEMRREAGLERHTWSDGPSDHTLHGLDALLTALSGLDLTIRETKARLLWEALAELESRGTAVFSGTYRWGYSHESKSTTFDAAFVRRLNEVAWVPGPDGALQPPGNVLFGQTGWTLNPFLLSKIRFKPPVVEQLAKEAGIDPGVIMLLKQLGLTSAEQLKARLGMDEKSAPAPVSDEARQAVEQLLGRPYNPEAPAHRESERGEPRARQGAGAGAPGDGRSGRASAGEGTGQGIGGTREGGGGARRPGTAGGRPFISYVAAHPDDDGPDPDGLDQQQRLALEEKAIEFVLGRERGLRRTPQHNPGFDLFEAGPDGLPARWVEVKAMTGGLADRPVGMSKPQFDEATRRGDRYWLYAVERAGTDDARIVRIQDPAGKARTFTFDRGWLNVADFEQDADSV
jgi:hypothetical protein